MELIIDYADYILSYGAGVNSTALAILLINEGWRGSIVFSDTGTEWPDTYCFMDYFEKEWLEPRGFEITRLYGEPWQLYGRQVNRNPCSLVEYCEGKRVIPFPAVRWCTVEWKVKPLKRWANSRQYMIGIAADEAHRQPEMIRPLVDMGVGRDECISIIEAEGLSAPQKSGCYICPFQRLDQWRDLWDRHPDLFERAVRLEENAKRKNGRGDITLDAHGYTLRQKQTAFENQMVLPGMDMDALKRYKPCICGL